MPDSVDFGEGAFGLRSRAREIRIGRISGHARKVGVGPVAFVGNLDLREPLHVFEIALGVVVELVDEGSLVVLGFLAARSSLVGAGEAFAVDRAVNAGDRTEEARLAGLAAQEVDAAPFAKQVSLDWVGFVVGLN